MSVGILLVTHDNIGSSLLESLQKMLGTLPMPVKVLPVHHDSEPTVFRSHVEKLCRSLNQGQGVLILTDLYGATPAMIARSVIGNGRIRMVSGVNLPMLVRLMNYPTTDLDKLANNALIGGRQGILDVNNVLNIN
jgi:PTS system ascorbate-specific IIA component